ncbi:MAG TPA: TonB-dependent receptor, partial [Acidobacteriaceae bacterium]|nr:TonB-dependent receptor [Acidobacteriaceae bacterium]
FNPSVGSPVSSFAHSLGYTAPNTTVNAGADITITPHLVSTSRFGYYFENYHDFGYPSGGGVFVWQDNGTGATDANGNALPANLAQPNGTQTGALDNLTAYNANKAIEISQDISWYKSTSFGTHNFKFGYQMNRDSNTISQVYNEPYIQISVGDGGEAAYSPQTPTGVANCAPFEAMYPTAGCQGLYGFVTLYDYGTGGSAISYNHSIYGQDSWTIGRGVTIDAGVRVEHEFLPGEIEGYSPAVVPPDPINFGWKQKIAPRIGVAWDVFRNGKMKVFGSYGVFNDQMKLNLAISSFGGQYWNNCSYALDSSDLSSVNIPFTSYNGGRRYCAGPDATSNAALATAPAGWTFLENINLRAATPTCSTCNPFEEAVAPNLKPYQQHESVFGTDYQISRNLSLEVRWDRRRLDHVIEDSSVYNPALGGETFVIVNPGQGVDDTFSDFCTFLYSTDPSQCISPNGQYPPNNTIPAARSYDGVEFRLNKTVGNHWAGLFSYTYSHFRGNYPGLTSSDLADGGVGGRNAPNNSRSFDEPYFSYDAFGQSSSGLLPTDRPNKFKGDIYYRLEYLHKLHTDFGAFQYFYQGSPNTTYADVGLSYNEFPVDIVGRGKWINITQDPATGAITTSNPYTYRNPWYNQTDFNITQAYTIGESKEINFQATVTNLWNQRAVTAINEQVDTPYGGDQYITPGGYQTPQGVPFYAASMTPYPVQASLNGEIVNGQFSNLTASEGSGPMTISSEYGKPLYHQLPRNMILAVHFTF